MRIKEILLLFIVCSFMVVSCSKGRHEEFGRDLAKAFKSKKYKDFDTTSYNEVFKAEFKKIKPQLHDPIWISKIYKEEDKGLTLLGDFLVDGRLDTLNQYLLNSRFHGLNPDYFHAKIIADLLTQVKTKKFKSVEESYPVLAQLELYCADGLINYAGILKYGAVNPRTVLKRYYVDVKRPQIIEAQQALDQIDIAKFLADIQPKNGYYQRLMNLLINDGKTDAKRLTTEDKEKIYLSMERLRWPVKEYKGKYLLVNIPEFQLRLIENNTTSLKMKVCVGEAGGHETPILSGMIDRMQVNPVWNIPKSIASTEILSSLKRDPYYLEAKNMVAYRNGELINSPEIDWKNVDISQYSFKQNPGEDNSLGQIKFIFQNPYAIYLHDTPAQAMFGQDMRAVSHGCVRVQKPIDLAKFLLNDESKLNKVEKEIQASSNGQKVEARWQMVKDPIPVFISYYTAWTNDDGTLVSSKDVYGYDKMLLPKLKPYMANL
ncbi:L,D-transpeptidase family protein [Pedobacter arcticus]|uniref:L,D-transpeptidase family protein n=1 Tax=Pedobacter arcticus TaxID=752140 RepID=UPI00058DE40C|nr:L,D-transpeptidase family protein [Pedobacter arcticus]